MIWITLHVKEKNSFSEINFYEGTEVRVSYALIATMRPLKDGGTAIALAQVDECYDVVESIEEIEELVKNACYGMIEDALKSLD